MTIYFIISFIVIAGFSAPSIIVSIENKQFKENQETLKKEKSTHINSDVLVLYFSRSGNTAIMANRIAKMEKANLINIRAPKYEIGIKGLANAATSYQVRDVDIHPKEIDLSRYKKVYIGSPIWFYRPAPPVFEFAKFNNFKDKEVILFNSYNSNYGQNHIEEFKQLVTKKGAKSFKHKAIKRGRMGNQLTSEEFLSLIDREFSLKQ